MYIGSVERCDCAIATASNCTFCKESVRGGTYSGWTSHESAFWLRVSAIRTTARLTTRASSFPSSAVRSFRKRCFALSTVNQVRFRPVSCGGPSRKTSHKWAITACLPELFFPARHTRYLEKDFSSMRPCTPASSNASIAAAWRSEEHTSELQSRGLISYAVFCL